MNVSGLNRSLALSLTLGTALAAGCVAEDVSTDLADEADVAPAGARAANDSAQRDPGFGGGDGVKRAYAARNFPLDAVSVTATSDHKLVFAAAWNAVPGSVVIGRVLADGTEDPAWDGGGPVAIALAKGVVGDVVMSGSSTIVSGGLDKKPMLTKLKADGLGDNAFGNQFGTRTYTLPWASQRGWFSDMLLTRDGKLLAGGFYAGDASHSYMIIGRFGLDGVPDGTFGNHGFIRYPVDPANGNGQEWAHLAKAGSRDDFFACGPGGEARVYKFDKDGHRDTHYDGRLDGACNDLTVTSSGVVYALTNWRAGGLVTALDASGARIASFDGVDAPGPEDGAGTTYVYTSRFDVNVVNDIQYSEALRRIYVIGYAVNPGTNAEFLAVALRADGERDDSFGGEGLVRAGIAASDYEYAAEGVLDGESLNAVGAMLNRDNSVVMGAPMVRWRLDAGGAGEPCHGNGGCDATLTCQTLGGVRQCAAPPAPEPPDQPHPPDPPVERGGLGEPCNSGARCDTSAMVCESGTCRLKVQGEICFQNVDCPDPMSCVAGRCIYATPGTGCGLNPGNGCCASCTPGNCVGFPEYYCHNGLTCSPVGGVCQ